MAKTNGARNRSVGHAFELVTAKQIKGVFPHIASTRSCNRARDNEGIDLCNKDEYKNGRLPYNIQCKSVTGNVQYLKLMNSMPKEKGIMNVVFHRYTEKQVTKTGDKFYVKGEFAISRMVDYIELVKAAEVLRHVMLHIDKLPQETQLELAPVLSHLSA
jgi:hypothetical protein